MAAIPTRTQLPGSGMAAVAAERTPLDSVKVKSYPLLEAVQTPELLVMLPLKEPVRAMLLKVPSSEVNTKRL